MARFSWSTAMFGASRLAAAVSPGERGSERGSAPGVERVTWALQGELGELLRAAFQAGDDLTGDFAELAAEAMAPWRWPSVAARLAESSLDTLRVARPDAAGALARQELKNKLEVFWWVKGARRTLGHPLPGTPFELRSYVETAYQQDAYRALWLIEGLGHDYVESALAASRSPRRLLRGEAVADLPENSLPMLHGGLGLACAEHVLGSLSPASSAARGREALERFVELCRDNAQARHLDSALESLGLETRCFFPELVPVVDRALAGLDDPALHRFFWHGLGRALYFLPVSFIPGYGSLWHAVGMAKRETPGETARQAALAGVSYAFTMVNMARPEILERVLREHGGEVRGTAFGDGIVAAVVMRRQITPGAPVLRAFVDYRPPPESAAVWREIVGEPCRRALDRERQDGGWRDRQVTDVYRSLPGGGAEA